MAIVGIYINESSITTQSSGTNGFTNLVLVITSAAATGLNTLTNIKDVVDFVTKFPGTVDAVLQTVKLIFTNNPSAKVSVISGSDASVVTTGDAKIRADLLFGIAALNALSVSYLAVAVCPQNSVLAAQADRTAVFAALESMAAAKRWLHFANTASTVITKAAAVIERALYSSPNGNSALYYGYALDSDGKNVPIAGAAAAILLLRSQKESIFDPPGGSKYPVTGIQSINGNITTKSDYDDLKASNINCIQNFPTVGFAFWLARSLATDLKFAQINSRMAMSIVALQLELSLIPSLIDSIDPFGSTKEQIILTCHDVMRQAYLNGGLSGATSEQAYRIEESIVSSGGDLRKIQIRIFAKFVSTLEEIEIQLTNVDVIAV